MEDAAAVLALREGDLSAFGCIYDRYADRLHAYAVTILRDHEAAADAVHDTFLLAHDRIDQLRDPDLLRPWLYAITRNQAQRMLRGRGRTTDLEAAADVRAEAVHWDRSLDADEARLLVLAALAGLSDRDREVIELSLRHELDNASMARALGHSSSHMSALVSRAKQQFDVAVTSVLLMRTRGRDCTDLRELLADDTTLTPLLRKRIARHARSCDACSGNRRAAIAVLPGIALALPFTGAPESLRSSLIDAAGTPKAGTALRASIGLTLDDEGFPTSRREPRRWLAAATIAAVLALALVSTTGNQDSRAGNETTTAPAAATSAAAPTAPPLDAAVSTPTPARTAPPPTTTALTPTPSASEQLGSVTAAGNGVAPLPAVVAPPPASSKASAAAPPTSPRTPASTPTPTAPTPSRTTAPAAVPSVSFDWVDLDPAACTPTFDIRITATVSGAPVSSVSARWRASTGTGSGSVRLVRVSSQQWESTFTSLPAAPASDLVLDVVTTQGIRVSTPAQQVIQYCGS